MRHQNEEARQLLRRIVESLAWRQLAEIDILGHCLKFVAELDDKLRVASELDLNLRLFHEVRALYQELGEGDLESAVRERRRMPYPGSRMEFGAAYFVLGQTAAVAMRGYVDSSYPRFAAIALSYVEAASQRPEPTRFFAFCEDSANHPQAQQFLNRWLAIGFSSFGRPDSPADRRAVELGLRTLSAAEMQDQFHESLIPFLARSGLSLPPMEMLGLQGAG